MPTVTPTDADRDRDLAARLLCESDHRWERMNGDQRAVWLRNAHTDPKMQLLVKALATARAEEREACATILIAEAEQLERWANESRSGGWSTHQVEPMRRRADELRRTAAGTVRQ